LRCFTWIKLSKIFFKFFLKLQQIKILNSNIFDLGYLCVLLNFKNFRNFEDIIIDTKSVYNNNCSGELIKYNGHEKKRSIKDNICQFSKSNNSEKNDYF